MSMSLRHDVLGACQLQIIAHIEAKKQLVLGILGRRRPDARMNQGETNAMG